MLAHATSCSSHELIAISNKRSLSYQLPRASVLERRVTLTKPRSFRRVRMLLSFGVTTRLPNQPGLLGSIRPVANPRRRLPTAAGTWNAPAASLAATEAASDVESVDGGHPRWLTSIALTELRHPPSEAGHRSLPSFPSRVSLRASCSCTPRPRAPRGTSSRLSSRAIS